VLTTTLRYSARRLSSVEIWSRASVEVGSLQLACRNDKMSPTDCKRLVEDVLKDDHMEVESVARVDDDGVLVKVALTDLGVVAKLKSMLPLCRVCVTQSVTGGDRLVNVHFPSIREQRETARALANALVSTRLLRAVSRTLFFLSLVTVWMACLRE